MDIKLSEDQVEISRQARRFCENECPMDYVRAMYEDERGFEDTFWTKMAELGWMAMRIPEAYGGLDLELMDLAVVLEEMGRAVLPGPFFSTVMLATEALIEAGNESQKTAYLSKMATGELKGTLALCEPDGGADITYIQMGAEKRGETYVLNGTKVFVPDAHTADFMVVAANTLPGQGVSLFLVDPGAEGVTVTTLPTMDGTRKVCTVEFKDVTVKEDDLLGAARKGREPLERVLQRAQVGLCAESIGGARRATEIASEYAKVRVQFDQPIGAFQAIKHRCAQMFLETESGLSILYWAAWAQDHGDANEAALAASVAKAYCSEAYTKAASSAIQVLGGTGFSWEHDIHLHLKRAKGNELTLGDPAFHRSRVVAFLEG